MLYLCSNWNAARPKKSDRLNGKRSIKQLLISRKTSKHNSQRYFVFFNKIDFIDLTFVHFVYKFILIANILIRKLFKIAALKRNVQTNRSAFFGCGDSLKCGALPWLVVRSFNFVNGKLINVYLQINNNHGKSSKITTTKKFNNTYEFSVKWKNQKTQTTKSTKKKTK